MDSIPLRRFCASETWTPVYLDEVAAVFLRNTPDHAGLIRRLKIDCNKTVFTPPASLLGDSSFRARAELFQYLNRAGDVLYMLSRNNEADATLAEAQKIFPDAPESHYARGKIYEAGGRVQDAEREYQTSIRLEPTEDGWYSLAMIYYMGHRFAEAENAVRHAAGLSIRPSRHYWFLGRLYQEMHRPQDALAAFDAATGNLAYEPPEAKSEVELLTAKGRARAWLSLGRFDRASEFGGQALQRAPSDPDVWLLLADIYAAEGHFKLEQEARQHARMLASGMSAAWPHQQKPLER